MCWLPAGAGLVLRVWETPKAPSCPVLTCLHPCLTPCLVAASIGMGREMLLIWGGLGFHTKSHMPLETP